MTEVPENGRKRGLKRALSEDDGETGEHNIGCRKDGDCHKDDIGDLVIDGVEELDKTSEEKKDCRVHQERDVLDYPACME